MYTKKMSKSGNPAVGVKTLTLPARDYECALAWNYGRPESAEGEKSNESHQKKSKERTHDGKRGGSGARTRRIKRAHPDREPQLRASGFTEGRAHGESMKEKNVRREISTQK